MCKAQRSQKDEAQMAIGVPDALDGARSAAAQLAYTADEAFQFLLRSVSPRGRESAQVTTADGDNGICVDTGSACAHAQY